MTVKGYFIVNVFFWLQIVHKHAAQGYLDGSRR